MWKVVISAPVSCGEGGGGCGWHDGEGRVLAEQCTAPVFVSTGRTWPSVLEFLNILWWLGTEKEQGCRIGPPGYTAWWNWFLGIDSWAP